MELRFDITLATDYRSGSQIARVLTEAWVKEHMFCPRCGQSHIERLPNNCPVADFYCSVCKNEYELKSKNGGWTHKVTDGAYDTMLRRIMSNKNPDFFFMNYSKKEWMVTDCMFIPKHFFVPSIIEKRKPLADSSRRARWVGCNILIDQIPMQGRIFIISNGIAVPTETVLEKVHHSSTLEIQDINARGWLMDVLHCVDLIPDQSFSLADIYEFEKSLCKKHPKNRHIKAKIRQQLQILRDRGIIEFSGSGHHKKRKFAS
ncbi:MAG: DpnI domain-containing protein [Planctomycetia bacterium]|nr:DpnI domain-containing protein [Planctomycetia bacterium]